MSTGLLDFFTLEAGEYLERLDGLLAQAGSGPPALDPFLTDARALRGSATMAKQAPIAELASALERLAKALRDSTVPWSAGVRGVVISAVDDLKILVRAVRTWGPADDQRAQTRTQELTQLAPARTRRSSGVMAGGSFVYVASESGDLAASLLTYTQDPSQSSALLAVLPRVRALRGMASLRDVPPLADVIEAIEDAAKPLELGSGALAQGQLSLLRTAAAVLARAAVELRAGGLPDPNSAEARQFAAALDAALGEARSVDDVVPVSSLFYADAGPHVVSAAPSPPTNPGQRFRMEVVSQAEHLQRLVGDARSARDDAGRTRAGRALRGGLTALRATAESFGEHDVARFVANTVGAAASLDSLALNAISEAATLLSNPATEPAQLAERLTALASGRSVDTAIGAGFSPVGRGTPTSVEKTEPHMSTMLQAARITPASAQTTAPAPHRATLTPIGSSPAVAAAPAPVPVPPPQIAHGSGATQGRDLKSLLASSIAGLTKLDNEPFSPPAHIEDDDAVPIEEFFYRGRAALDRALELRAAIRARGGPAETAEVEEIFALLELAAAE